MDKHNKHFKWDKTGDRTGLFLLSFLFLLLLHSCARMGQPDGGWYDETPPKVIGATPAENATNVHRRHIFINFDEFITIDNPTENVVVSPPQLEAPEIKGQGKRISVELMDSLKPNTTYTIDFSNAISDNNEGNPLGNYTYSFSTGDHIDTLEVAGYVLEADNLEPVKGILVGLYSNLEDSAFQKSPMMRVSRTDSRGHFIIRGVAPGTYRIYALKDADGDYRFGQKSEMIAFNHQTITPSFKPDVRQDTTWLDTLHIASINDVHYTHFLPDDICLRAFTGINTDRYFVKAERKEANHFSLFYSYGDTDLPVIHGLNFNADNAFVIDPSAKRDTITYWLRDTALINQDTLEVELQHHITDSLGVLRLRTDTVTILSKQPYAKRLKEQKKAYDKWAKEQEKKKKKGEPYDTVMAVKPLEIAIDPSSEMDPDQNVTMTSTVPIKDVDIEKMVHLYSQPPEDSLWYREPFEMTRVNALSYLLKASWKPDYQYSLEIDSTAFQSIYGDISGKIKTGLKVRGNDTYASLLVTLNGMQGKHVIAQLIDEGDKVIKQAFTDNAQAEFYYLKEGKYYLRMIEDVNNNKQWDTGDFSKGIEPEPVYYYPEVIECRAKWDATRSWSPTDTPLYRQKPSAITKQKADKQKQVQHRNADRAKKLGIQYIPKP
jgi:uncharacterized protein (DUF2141 family)